MVDKTSVLFYGCPGGRSFVIENVEPVLVRGGYFVYGPIALPPGWMGVWQGTQFDANYATHDGCPGILLSQDIEELRKGLEILKKELRRRRRRY